MTSSAATTIVKQTLVIHLTYISISRSRNGSVGANIFPQAPKQSNTQHVVGPDWYPSQLPPAVLPPSWVLFRHSSRGPPVVSGPPQTPAVSPQIYHWLVGAARRRPNSKLMVEPRLSDLWTRPRTAPGPRRTRGPLGTTAVFPDTHLSPAGLSDHQPIRPGHSSGV